MNDLQYLYDRSLTIACFLLQKNPNAYFIVETKNIVEKTYEAKNIKGMNHLSRDLSAWAKVLPHDEKKELDDILFEKFGERLSGDKIVIETISNILKRNPINNKKEYRIVSEYLNDIDKDDEFYDRVEDLVLIQKKYLDGG